MKYDKILLYIMLLLPYLSYGQEPVIVKSDRILVVLNGSAGMAGQWGKNNSLYDIAADITGTMIGEVYKVNEDVEFGLRVYGHQYKAGAGNCKDTRREVPFSKDNLAQMALRLKDITPRGNGSVEYAIAEAIRQDITDTHLYRYSIIVFTDSSRACADNICIPLNEQGRKDMFYKRYFVDLSGKEKGRPRYACFDKVFPATNDYSIDTFINAIVKDFKKRPQRQVRVVYQSKTKPQNVETLPAPKKPAMPIAAKTPEAPVTPPVKTDTPAKKTETAVQIRKSSKIKSEIDEFGYLKIGNTSIVSRIIIYREQDGGYVQTNEMYPVGMNEVKVKLKTGSYKMLYNVSGLTEGTRSFEIKNDTISEIWFR